MAQAADWPQYRGPNHDGVSTDRIRTNWYNVPPRVVWRVPLTSGYSSFAVSQGKAVTMITLTNSETCVALNANTGTQLWVRSLEPGNYPNGYDGPRSTPTIDGNRVYCLTSHLKLFCLDLANGTNIWQTTVDRGGGVIAWQAAASPRVDGSRIFINCNQSGQALLTVNKTNGVVVSVGESDLMTHATPVAATIGNVRQMVFFSQSGLVGVNATNGAVLWRYPFTYNNTSVAASPVVVTESPTSAVVYCGADYNSGGAVARVTQTAPDAFSVAEVWKKTGNNYGNHWSTPVCVSNNLYGMYGASGSCPFRCLNLNTGTIVWSGPSSGSNYFGPGGVVVVNARRENNRVVDGILLIQSEGGNLVLARPITNSLSVITRTNAVLSGADNWNSLAVANGRIYARSTAEGICLDVAQVDPVVTSLTLQAGGHFRVQSAGTVGMPCDIWCTTNLVTGTWTNLGSAVETPAGSGNFSFIHSNAADLPARFYKVRQRL
jgi:outer membrane protein assembly factor BamB